MIAIVAMSMTIAACGNSGSIGNSGSNADDSKKGKEAPVAYEQIKIEKYGASFDLPKGMRRTDNPQMDNGGAWTFVPEDYFFAIDAAVDFSVYESIFGDYTDERIQREFDEDLPEEAVKTLDLAKKEYRYSVDGENKEFHRVIFKDNKSINVMVVYTDEWASKLGGEVCEHVLNSAKFD